MDRQLVDAVLDHICESLGVDEYSIRNADGLTWWPDCFAQRVLVEESTSAEWAFALTIETDLLRRVTPWAKVLKLVTVMNSFATLSRYANFPDGSVRSFMRLHFSQENQQWLTSLAAVAAGMQLAECSIAVNSEIFNGLDCEVATSRHPTAGARGVPHDIALTVIQTIRGHDKGTSAFIGRGMEALAEMNPSPWVLANASSRGLAAEFKFQGEGRPHKFASNGCAETSLLRITTEERNPRWGTGALIQLWLPVRLAEEERSLLIGNFNREEFTESPPFHLLGAWCDDPNKSLPVHVAFLPSALAWPGMLSALLWHFAARADWCSERFARGRPFI